MGLPWCRSFRMRSSLKPSQSSCRKQHLLKTFGSLKRIREASLDDLTGKGKLPATVAENLLRAFGDSGNH